MKKPDLYEFKPMLGPPEEWPVGSVEWAERISNRLQATTKNISRSTARYVEEILNTIIKADPPPWEVWPDEIPFGTPDDYCEAVTGYSWESLCLSVAQLTGNEKLMPAVLARAQAEHRKPGRRPQSNLDNIKVLDYGGTGSEYLLRRLAREHSDIFEAYERDEFKSVRAAAIAAGIVKVKTPLEQLRNWWKKASDEERQTFRKEITP